MEVMQKHNGIGLRPQGVELAFQTAGWAFGWIPLHERGLWARLATSLKRRIYTAIAVNLRICRFSSDTSGGRPDGLRGLGLVHWVDAGLSCDELERCCNEERIGKRFLGFG